MKILVLYFSVSGNTEKVAQVIGKSVDGELVRIYPKGQKKVVVPIAVFQTLFKAAPKIDPFPIEPAGVRPDLRGMSGLDGARDSLDEHHGEFLSACRAERGAFLHDGR